MLTGASILHALLAAQLRLAQATSLGSRHLVLAFDLAAACAGARSPFVGVVKPLQQLLLSCHKVLGDATVLLSSEGLVL